MRLILVGDSQVSGLKHVYDCGLKQQLNARGVDVDFIAAIGPIAMLMETSGSKLLLRRKSRNWDNPNLGPAALNDLYIATQQQFDSFRRGVWPWRTKRTLSGKREIDLSDYDIVVSVGGWLTRQWLTLASAIGSDASSRAFVKELAEEFVKNSNAYRWLGKSGASKELAGKVLFMPDPILNEMSPEMAKYVEARHPDFWPTFEVLRFAMERLGLVLLPFPEGLLNDDATAMSRRFKSKRPGDFAHLNDEGSATMLLGIVEQAERRSQHPQFARRIGRADLAAVKST